MDIFRQELTFEELTSDIIKEMYHYWQEKRSIALYPSIHAIDLDELPLVKPYAIIADLQYPPFRILYRFMGERLVHFYGRDISGQWLDDVLDGEILDDFEIAHRMAVTSDEPLLARSNWYGIDTTSHQTYEWAMFPISENGIAVTGNVVVEDYSHLDVHELPVFLQPHHPNA